MVGPALTAAFSGVFLEKFASKVMGVKKAFDVTKEATKKSINIFAEGAIVAEKSLKDLSIAQQFAAGAGQAAAAGVGKFSAGLAGLKTVMVAHPVMTFALALGAIVGAAALVTRAIQGMHDQAHPALSNLKEKTKELKKANEDLVASTDKVVKKEEANIALAREKEQSVANSIDKLDRLIQKNDRSADSNKEIQKTVKELNNAYGDLNLTWDETNATLNHSIDQLREYNSVMRKTAEAEAYGKIHSELMQFTRILPMDRRPVTVAHQLKISKPILSLNTDAAIVAIRAGLQALSFTRYQDEAVIQIILGSSLAPSQVSQELPNPHASWLEVFTGTVGKASPETRKSAKDKAEQYRFQCLVRIGISTQHAGIGRLDNILSAFRVLEASGVRIRATRCDPIQINTASIPWQMPLRLSVEELSCFFVASGRRGELCRSTGSAPSSSVASLLVPKTETYRKQADL